MYKNKLRLQDSEVVYDQIRILFIQIDFVLHLCYHQLFS